MAVEHTWHRLEDGAGGECATDKCENRPVMRLEAGGVGSNYCEGCFGLILAFTDDDEARNAEIAHQKQLEAPGAHG